MSQHRLQIRLNVRGERGYFPSFLPVNVVDARGQVLSTGAVATRHATEFRYERGEAPLFVRLTLPNGTTETQPLQTPDRMWRDEVAFSIGDDAATSDWMAWSAMRLNMKRHGGALLSHPGMKDAWFQLWEKTPDSPRWRQIPMEEQLTNLPRSREAIQLEVRSSPNPRALVVRLDSDTPQVVSLPSEETSVLVTSLRTLSGVVTPRVVVGGYSPNAEAIMEFLRAGMLSPVESMLDPGSKLAHQLLRDKVMDPIAATAAAYYLLRKRDWDRLPPRWLDNLTNWYEWIPDAKLIRATSQIERGMPMDKAAKLAVETLSRFLDHGIPLFAEANSLLSDLLALAEKAERPLDTRTAKTLRTMLASSRPAGLSFGFAGKAPDKPMAAHQAFERRQEVRGGQLLAEAARQMAVLTDFETIRQPPTLDNEASRRQFRLAAETLRLSVDVLLAAPQRAVSGSAAKTLFLQNVLNETQLIAR
ncbi:hypothetical protein F3J24_18545 [Comamonas sp. Tr-654]|uniref:hypothetical protein n=1 Tax=Comamonas sp. Tr-654 TaxID=2608341 RepID=UPI00141E0B5D|nr:hypothetical protein [Comamonas sp. Tr-654]NIF85503.1 hypothetical protein [Comamonas sp. Tr-654]